ncbi:alkaline phosphatase family protein [Candidatus Tisiphia endosymbiont of Temnostethus pusillus]|uniref:alkaline phosphatase family protein n=1 Tax=Candidatus Tisiphia endosymbiont of Temnostethus pusillus TaxID=3139335 RepID=UPI0035C8EA5D
MSNNFLNEIKHIIVLMMENRSFDHMLGFLYTDQGNKSPSGQAFEGLTGNEFNYDTKGNKVNVFKITPDRNQWHTMPGSDPGEGYWHTNVQLFGKSSTKNININNSGFVKDFGVAILESAVDGYSHIAGTVEANIMGMFTPETLPVISTLATKYVVFDHWFASAPSQTFPNRNFACAGTTNGYLDNTKFILNAPTIFGLLSKNNISWSIYGYDSDYPLARSMYPDTKSASPDHFGVFEDFQQAVNNGTLASYVWLEPDLGFGKSANDQHPGTFDVSRGEKLMYDVYYTLRNSPIWNDTLLIITYDEHGGCYDHVAPPNNATPPDHYIGYNAEFNFYFNRFGVRVPTIAISPRIQPGTVCRAKGNIPFDHTSILKTIQKRWNLPSLTKRDADAEDIGDILSLEIPRTDDALAGITPLVSQDYSDNLPDVPYDLQVTLAQSLHSELISNQDLKLNGYSKLGLKTKDDYKQYIQKCLKLLVEQEKSKISN